MLALLVALLLQGEPQSALAPTLRGQARVESSAQSVDVGEPFTLELTVRHAPGDAPTLDAHTLEADPSWAVLSSGAITTLADPKEAGVALTHASWQVVSLEPGERDLPAPSIAWGTGDTAETIDAARAKLAVRGVLGPDEDAPRPIGKFIGLDVSQEARFPLAMASGIGGALALAAVLFVIARKRRRRKAQGSRLPTALERLAALEEAPLEQPEAVVEAHVELARALREAIDASLGASGPGLTDREWAATVAARLGSGTAEACAELLAACEPVKYGAERPTHWAARERIARARELAASAAGARPTAEVRA